MLRLRTVGQLSRRVVWLHSSRVGTQPSLWRPSGSLLSTTSSAAAESSSGASAQDNPVQLRRDVGSLGKLLGTIIRDQSADGKKIFDVVEDMRRLGREWRSERDGASDQGGPKFQQLVNLARDLTASEMRLVARAFAQFLTLANSAEGHHRVRKLQEREVTGENWPMQDSVIGTVQSLLESDKATAEEIFESLCQLQAEIVLTAHPTEVNRRTVIRKHQQVAALLHELDSKSIPTRVRDRVHRDITQQIELLWHTDEIRREKPTPIKEARQGLNIVTESLWTSVPAFLRRLDAELESNPDFNKPLPPDIAPVVFASWMGGDRDGNPNVTPEVTREVSINSRLTGAGLIRSSFQRLANEVTVHRGLASAALLNELPSELAESSRQPYTDFFLHLDARMSATETMLHRGALSPSEEDLESSAPPLTHKAEVIRLLMVAYKSLEQCNLESVANGGIKDLIRQISCFGLCLLPLDIRQESTRHAEALDAITQYLGIGSYLEWDEDARLNWLKEELRNPRSLLPRGAYNYSDKGDLFSPTVCDTLETFDMISQMPKETLGAYVISMARSASDVLAVHLLQRESGVPDPIRVVPLFETLADLTNANGVMEQLFSLDWYAEQTGSTQEVMIGYSDSAKDAGRIAAAWAQYCAQEQLAQLAQQKNWKLTFFHGKGGTVSRGGDPSTFRAIAAQPPGTVNGKFRITEQGEIITQNYALATIASRHLDIFTAGLLNERFLSPDRAPHQEWRELMDKLAETSCEAYRGIVRGEPRFIPYFRAATPELEIASLNVGSRPAKRRPTGGVETLRAIPWVFAWTQTRLNLTAWLGIGPAFASLGEDDYARLKDMHSRWPWFQALVDLVDMVLAKTESPIAANYDKQLVSTLNEANVAELEQLGEKLREELGYTKNEILRLREYTTPQQENKLLCRSLQVRNPYVDPLNVLQAEVLRRLRQDENDEEDQRLLEDTLILTINGIANGQKNTG